jgi:enoyl-[acyl-carrier protein] reductase III
VALVTGGSRGIGRAIALELASRGADIVVNYVRHRQAAEETCAEVERQGVRAYPVKANVGDKDRLDEMFDLVEGEFGRLDILVGNAASGVQKPVTEVLPKDWEWTVGINAQSILWGAQLAVPLMERNGWGRIVTLTSFGSTRVYPDYAVVGISKAAIEALTRYLAVELAARNIIVNAVSPGVVETEALNYFPHKDQIINHSRTRTPAGRLVEPEDVAKLVAFLCSDDARMIVGQTITIDGGYSVLA